jgi:four helix bundle protein
VRRAHEKLEAWKLAMELVTELYRETSSFPKDEIYGLTSQIRRAAVSIPANLAEGAARSGPKEFIQFLHIARGSLSELETLLQIAFNLGYIKKDQAEMLANRADQVSALLSGLLRSLKNPSS